MKNLSFTLMFVLIQCVALGQDIYQKDGKILRASGMRRDGGVIFARVASPVNGQETALVTVNAVERIVFPDDPRLRDAAASAYAGDAASVLSKTVPLFSYARQWADIPGNTLTEVLRLMIPGLLASRKMSDLSRLVESWVPTNDPDLESVVQLLKLKISGADKASFEHACKLLVLDTPGTLGAAVAWMEQGYSALEERNWASATRAFASVRLFSQNWRLLQPAALLGAIEACRGNGSSEQTAPFMTDLLSEYSETPQARTAKNLPPLNAPKK